MSWKSIRGHELVVQSFNAAWKRGRLGHAYLFVGPSGVGKRTFANEFAKALLCENAKDALEACDQCTGCALVAAGTHPDFFVASRPEESLELPIEVIRESSANLALKPARGTRKVAILDDADDLNDASANAFLKTLEEPPPGSVLILVGGPSSETQLSTIVSRCQVIRFLPLRPTMLKEILKEQGITEPSKLDRLIRLSGGSIGQALALDDDELWNFRQSLLEAIQTIPLDTVALAQQWWHFVEEAGKDASSQRRRATLVLRLFIEMLENALRISLKSGTDIDPKELKSLAELAQKLGSEKIMKWIDRALAADYQIDRKVQLVLVVEAFVDSLRIKP